ncbi:MAG: O-antigen ligase family protein [Planctomycetes bacterium]|nr:O-antigen ligase family protein [Planctomycetota bacterium]
MRNLVKYILPAIFLAMGGIYVAQSIVLISPEIGLALACGAVLGTVSFLYPNIGVYFVLITLFFPEISIGAVGTGMTAAKRDIGIRPEDILIVLISVGWFARLVAKRQEILIPHTPVNTLVIILSFVMVFTTLHGALVGSVPLATGFFYVMKKLEYFVVFFMVITNIKTEKEIKTGIAILMVASIIVALWGIVEYTILSPEMDLSRIRISGPFRRSQANILGGFFIIIIFIALGFLFKYRPMKFSSKTGLLGLIILSLIAVVLTRSRSSYSAIFAGFIIFSLLARRYYLLIIPILLISFMQYLFPPQIVETIHSIRGVQERGINPSWDARWDAWKEAWENKISKNPVIGHGLGSVDLAWVDNQYVLDLVYMGVIGLGLFIWLLFRLFGSAAGFYRDTMDSYNKGLSLGFMCLLIGLMIQGIAVTNFYTIRTMVPFWFVTGLVMVARNLEIGKSEQPVKVEGIEST